MAGFAYFLLERFLIAQHGPDSVLATALGRDKKGIASQILYLVGTGIAFIIPWGALGIYIFVACLWFVPDRRIERLNPRALNPGDFH